VLVPTMRAVRAWAFPVLLRYPSVGLGGFPRYILGYSPGAEEVVI
jgi:hypothetical protein